MAAVTFEHPRAPSRTLLCQSLCLLAACAPAPTGPAVGHEPRGPSQPPASAASFAVESTDPLGPAAASVARLTPPALQAAAETPLGSFERETSRFETRCHREPSGDSNVAMKDAANRTNECLQRAMVAELDRVLVPLGDSAPPRFAALMAEQAVFNRFVNDVCWVNEEARWVDPDKGTRDGGTAAGDAERECVHDLTLDRIYYAHALRLGNAAVFARHVARVASRKEGRDALATFVAKVGRLRAPAHPPETFPLTIDAALRDEIIARAKAAAAGAMTLATMECEGFVGLPDALGGTAACPKPIGSYYLAAYRPDHVFE